FLAGLGSISPEYYEAARLDGASEWQIFRKITFPLLSPTTFFVFTIATIASLRVFNQIYVLTNGGPLDTTRTVTMLVFRTFFQQTQLGLVAAMAFLLTLIILAFTLVQFRVLGRRVFYGYRYARPRHATGASARLQLWGPAAARLREAARPHRHSG